MAHTHHFTARRPNATVLVCNCGRIQNVVSEENPAIAGIPDTSHLVAIHERLHRERERLRNAKTPREYELRAVWVQQAEKELEAEYMFLGMDSTPIDMTDNELMEALSG